MIKPILATLRLFKALPIEKRPKDIDRDNVFFKDVTSRTIKRGFIFDDAIFHEYQISILKDLIPIVSKGYGLTAENMNRTLQNSWKKVKEAPILQLILEQITHYITTYGFSSLGMYSDDSVYIPTKNFDIPDIEMDKIKLTVIRGYTKPELTKKVSQMLQSGAALKEQTAKDLVTLAIFLDFDESYIESIQNKEIRIMFYDLFGTVPEDPIEFLRLMIYKLTQKTLLIKNNATIEGIRLKVSENVSVVNMFQLYDKKYGYKRLAEIFYRFKPLWLAFRKNESLKPIINKLRRLAKKYHKPFKSGYVDTITERISNNEDIDPKRLSKALENLIIFRKIRLANALKYRIEGYDSIMYRIRNGKAYAKEFDFPYSRNLQYTYDTVLMDIVKDMSPILNGKKIYIPCNVEYPLPTTEKAFIGEVPLGTTITLERNMLCGIHWKNIESGTVDLDLSNIDISGKKIGWDGAYRSITKNVLLFSGDLTSAPLPHGASELFYIEGGVSRSYIVMVNLYAVYEKSVSYDLSKGIPFKILVAEACDDFLNGASHKQYMVDPNKLICSVKVHIDEKNRNKTIGVINITEEKIQFIFSESTIGAQNRTATNNDYIQHARQSIINMLESKICMRDIIAKTSATLVDTPEEADIDLSPENLEKDTFLKLLKGDIE